ncbi:splicing factor 3B subunit 2 [Capsaspora owczarzaki ATCC 30864]|uniref:Splicing factor 3B subunit 2 n=1 Tax=Capsaspora owczarzaki (strain ATCC 30864) TaxID=595528 RepID=A0A0D2WW30_CAPO3|nr:splicing factor 3B subunit 2 [Capsaspora owczarzaki ATCC 30864]KJE96603.1 splicing factor 3B subunit 2 [Capsaspora owczarzaki ATCC 30864]|eukprot:XP_004344524.1 splicing factor 3B subunit 2 [Capsaspora owczarzaki ATCC 30864]
MSATVARAAHHHGPIGAGAGSTTAPAMQSQPQPGGKVLSGAALRRAMKKKDRRKQKGKKHGHGATTNGTSASADDDDDDDDDNADDDGGAGAGAEDDIDIEVEYVAEAPPVDLASAQYAEFAKAFARFQPQSADAGAGAGAGAAAEGGADDPSTTDAAAQAAAAQAAADAAAAKSASEQKSAEGDENDGEGDKAMSNRRRKMTERLTVAELKQLVRAPDVVEAADVTARDPRLLVTLKSARNTVAVPVHWQQKRKYLQNKRGQEKPPFDLPEFIKATGIMEMRDAVAEKEAAKSLKSKMRESVRPKMGKIGIEFQKLQDAFFKFQTKPIMSKFGEMYFEGKEFETRVTDRRPGQLSNELKEALGMPISGNSMHLFPPPWLIPMQRYGPPPSYPNLKVPGLNAPIPSGANFGYHPGGWGRPPVDEYGRPLYGDVFGTVAADYNKTLKAEDNEPIQRQLWGTLEAEAAESDSESEDEEAEDGNDEGAEGVDDGENEDEYTNGGAAAADDEEDSDAAERRAQAAIAAELHGMETPSGLSSIPAGLETPDVIELRKRRIESAMDQRDGEADAGRPKSLYQVIPEKRATVGGSLMGSERVYDMLGATTSRRTVGAGVDLALDPSELEGLDEDALRARLEAAQREQPGGEPKEDLSDLVAEHAARQTVKRKKAQDTGKSKKFKF